MPSSFDPAVSDIIFAQPPVDIFESDFIIQVFVLFVKGCKGSSVDYGHLLGALALSAAGVSNLHVLKMSTD